MWSLIGDGVEGRLEVLACKNAPTEPPGIEPARLGQGLSPRLYIGVTAHRDVSVDQMTATDHLDRDRRLLATPILIEQIEHAAAEVIHPYLTEGFGPVEVHNDVAHSRPAFPGETVRYGAVLVGVDGHRLVYAVSAAVGDWVVGHGRHESHVIRRTFSTQNI